MNDGRLEVIVRDVLHRQPMRVNKPPQCSTEVEVTAMDRRADEFQRFDECTLKVRRDCQRLPTKHGH